MQIPFPHLKATVLLLIIMFLWHPPAAALPGLGWSGDISPRIILGDITHRPTDNNPRIVDIPSDNSIKA